MSPLPLSNHQDLNSLLVFPLRLCAATTLTAYLLSVITGNVSQVDRLWTFMPTIYTAYWALLPLWPHNSATWRYLVPFVPDEASHFARDFSPRALLMLGLTVRVLNSLSPGSHLLNSFKGSLDVQVILQYLETWSFPAVRSLARQPVTMC
jgi:hypothetical protein